MEKNYVNIRTFEDMRNNTNKLITVLNHNMTKMKVDISWLKMLQGWEIAILIAILTTIVTIAIKL